MKRLIVEPPLPFGEAASRATADELAAARSFSPGRAHEYLAWRAVVRRELGSGVRIGYNDLGAPVLPDSPLYLSVSHTPGRVAVAIADCPCAVDIERAGRRFDRVLARYLTPDEQQLSGHPRFAAVAWCAKEALYKYAGRPGCDRLRDLRIEAVHIASDKPVAGTLAARCCGRAVEVAFREEEGFVCAAIFGETEKRTTRP